ncbi:MAG: MFS transporter [Actinobacteria bacterium]|nr:MFS transporter [Actinomycetota bacterium]MDA3003071.1 MFS transporter [Actinomycetota bacterium]
MNHAKTRTPTTWRNALFVVFMINGLSFSTWLARVPAIRDGLDTSTAEVAALLFTGALGAVSGLVFSSHIIAWIGQRNTILFFGLLGLVGLAGIGIGSSWVSSYALTVVAIICAGAGNGIADVAMNVEGAAVEKAVNRNIMPWFHAFWSLGTVAGAGLSALMSFLGVGIAPHTIVMALVMAPVLWIVSRVITNDRGSVNEEGVEQRSTLAERLRVWKEPRTLAIGIIALGMAFAEGSANDWLALAIVDGRDQTNAVGALWFGFFTLGMLAGRIGGVYLLDKFGRVPVLQWSAAMAIAGLALVILVEQPVLSGLGALMWGLGSSLGFPVGMSAAADNPEGSAARVSAVATVAYGAFLIGPPLIGGLGDSIGVLAALWVVVAVIVLAFFAAPAAKPPAPSSP